MPVRIEGQWKPGPTEDPFFVARLALNNIGDGPLDLLACLVAARELSSGHVHGLAVEARDVDWADLDLIRKQW